MSYVNPSRGVVDRAMDQRAAMVARPQQTFNIPMAPLQPHYPPQQQQQQRAAQVQVRPFYAQDPADAQSRMQESLKRSITLVFWYKVSNNPPLAPVPR